MLTLHYLALATIVIFALIILIIYVVLSKRIKSGNLKTEGLGQQIISLQQANALLREELHEVRSGAMGIGAKVKDLVIKVDLIQDKLQEIEFLDPDTKLYSQAAKMVDAGASVEELMRECDLPRAEAELLIAVKKSR
ncbi:DUF2802 domain-containing protein [Aliiglaciecola lipolytica]|uniref:DUF2802 domain-containing protein n=1 Tax=Aliiglaciecola lipolytica E3 TaxID=1127673 RepID=K6YXA5_9ALTE|nr:DUF2802 domain-containing protein [Aliiglaciecola lipolytica]GAC15865.1 hypothetical protein GLIP_3251 [Aliiglaciecola lipolytica E3]